MKMIVSRGILKKKNQKRFRISPKPLLVRETGLEPASSFEHMNLNHARLPIPPFPQSTKHISAFCTDYFTCFFRFVKHDF